MNVRVFFNDAAGGSFAPGVNAASDERRESATGRMGYLPMVDGYDPDKAVLVESMLSPLNFDVRTPDDLAVCERVFHDMNAENRPNGRYERSLSVGDVVVVGDQAFAVANVGFVPTELPGRLTAVRERVLAGERVHVRMVSDPQNGGVVFLRGDQIMYEVTSGWAAGVAEPICFRESHYFESRFMENFAEDTDAAEAAHERDVEAAIAAEEERIAADPDIPSGF